MELHQALEDARRRLSLAEKEQAELATQIGDLKDEVRGLELALRHHDASQLFGDLVPIQNGWAEMTRTDAVLRALNEGDAPMGPAEIAHTLRARGRPQDRASYVSAALAYLKNKGRVVSVGSGRWNLVETPETEERLATM
jgi:repressor of nif and glnA expression